MVYLKTNNSSVVLSALFIVASVYAERNFEYESTGIRDPMVRRVAKIATLASQNTTSSEKAKIARETRRKELQRIISQSKIEGVVFNPGQKPLVMINQKIINEGDRISKKSNVYVVKIELKKVVFSLDNETVTYVLSPFKKEPEP